MPGRFEHPLTAIQRHYLDAFDQHLLAATPEDARAARALMRERLEPLAEEAGIDLYECEGKTNQPHYGRSRLPLAS